MVVVEVGAVVDLHLEADLRSNKLKLSQCHRQVS